MFFKFSIGDLVTISTGAIVATTGTVAIGDGLAVSIGYVSLSYCSDVSVGSFVGTTCSSSPVVFTENVFNWGLQ